MSQTDITKIKGYLSFPRQKLTDTEKNEEWFKTNIDFAENILTSDNNLRNSFKNKKTNLDLRTNKLNPKDFERIINPDQLDLSTLPATFQHVGIENTKINLLVGEYVKRRKEWRVFLSSNDKDGISRKEQGMKDNLMKEMIEIINTTSISPQEIEKRLKAIDRYNTYDYQDIAEITANRILKKEFKEQDIDFLFSRTYEDLLVTGEQMVYCGMLGRNPVMRKVDTLNLFTIGGNSMNIEDSDIIIEYGYQAVGQVIDDYWDELKEVDIDFLESGKTDTKLSNAVGLNRDMSIYERYGEENAVQIFSPSERGTNTFAGAFDTSGNVRVVKVCWRTRRKIGELTYFDEDGEEQKDWVPETYKVNKDEGETIEWKWVNEWLEGTKIGDHIYTGMKAVPYAGKSLTNKSKGTPPYIGTVNSTNGYKVQSLTDTMKPLAYSYDVAYYKRELAIATYKGSFAALNSAMVPSGWDPKEWMRYVTINKFAWLDPTNEILKGPSQGKSAGMYNTLTATNVQLGDPNEIQMYTNLLVDIENTLGKLAGVTGAREGQIQNREAVGNVEREVAQTSHITEKWFRIDNNFRKRVLSKFLDVCKYAYKKYPQKGQYILDDMGQMIIDNFDEFASSEFDLHMSDSTVDGELYEELKNLSQAAIQNGQAKISDIIAVRKSESVQEISKRLEESAAKILEEQQQAQQEQMKSNQAMKQQDMQDKQLSRDFIASEAALDRELKREEIAGKLQSEQFKEVVTDARDIRSREYEDSDKNGIDDFLDVRRTDIDENYKREQTEIAKRKLDETERSNKAKENIARIQKKKTS